MGAPDNAPTLLAPERRAKILDLLRLNKSVLVKDLCLQFGVTGETVRKDLAVLEREGCLIKTYGGAYIQDGVRNEVDVSIRESLYPDLKDSIGTYCSRLVEAGDTVFLDESTTCLTIARHLLDLEGITVVTNSMSIAKAFAESGRGHLILSGGELDRKNQCFVGGSAEEFLSRFYVDRSFISCRGIDQVAGVTDGSSINGRIRSLMVNRARCSFLVLDHTKLGKANFFRICDFDAIDTVVVDAFPDRQWQEFFNRQGVKTVETMAAGQPPEREEGGGR